MQRKKNTLLNIIASLAKLALATLLSLVVSREILNHYGSSVNGVIATASQTTILLQILEGGFTTATLVALFKPFVAKEYDTFNRILSTTSSAFAKIALLTLLAGGAIAILYPLWLTRHGTTLAYWKCASIFGFITVSAALNFAFFQPRIIAFSVAQKEYVTQTSTMIFNTLSQLLMLLLVTMRADVVWLRAGVMVMLALNGVCICMLAKKEFPFLRLDIPNGGQKIRGTKDVIIGNVVSALYAAGPIFMIATVFGTAAASIYSVYYLFFSIISHTLFAIAVAPKNAFGQLLYDEKAPPGKFDTLYTAFETVIAGIGTIAYVTAFVVILPLLRVYTQKMSDSASYIEPFYALFFAALGFTQIIHIPSGLLMQISGRFRAIKMIQSVMLALMLIFGALGAAVGGLKGMLCGFLGANCILACCEITYSYRTLLKKKPFPLAARLGILFCLGLCIIFAESKFPIRKTIWGAVLAYSAVIAIVNTFLLGGATFFLMSKPARKQVLDLVNLLFKRSRRAEVAK